MNLDLQDALERLYGLERRKHSLGLDGTRLLLAALGDPQRKFRSIHVAGTNGKGSTCAVIERVLRAAGHRTGLFTSPHLVDFRERFRVNGRWADAERLGQRLAHVSGLPAGADRTFFEVCTALGFDDFAARDVEWAVIEVGLGGRLDCTNLIEPELCVITSIGLDHTEILGDTIEQIAAEKAGIIKRGIPVVVAERMDPRARAVIESIARERGAPIVEAARRVNDQARSSTVEFELQGSRWNNLHFAGEDRLGTFQLANLGTALAALSTLDLAGLELSSETVERGVREARWPGRLERAPNEPRLWWDGAHNAHGMAALSASWRRRSLATPAAVVLAVSRDKNVPEILAQLRRFAGDAVLFATRTRNSRALEPEQLAGLAWEAGIRARTSPGLIEALRAALALPGEAPVLLAGSLFAVGEAMEVFGGAPGEQL